MAAPQVEHELHKRRFSRNLGVALTLVSFVFIVFGLTYVKITNGGLNQGLDHVVRPEMLPAQEGS
ncbi:MAG: hypothetical protein AAF672_09965 [Pseudomonadota bacterium]